MSWKALGLGVVLISLTAAEPQAAAQKPARPFIAQDVVATDRAFRLRQKRLDDLLANATSRDANGEVEQDYRYALPSRNRCGSRGCLDAWYARQEAALSKWEGAEEILAQAPR